MRAPMTALVAPKLLLEVARTLLVSIAEWRVRAAYLDRPVSGHPFTVEGRTPPTLSPRGARNTPVAG